jgi:hypothetical protein
VVKEELIGCPTVLWLEAQLTAIARMYMKHTVRTSGRLVRPVDDFLKRIQSVGKKRVVNMPARLQHKVVMIYQVDVHTEKAAFNNQGDKLEKC